MLGDISGLTKDINTCQRHRDWISKAIVEQKKHNKFYSHIHFKAKHLNKSDLATDIPEAPAGFNYTKNWQTDSCHQPADSSPSQTLLST